MRLAINLATRPYVEMGAIYKRLRLMLLALAVLALPLWFAQHSESRKASAAHARLAASQQRLSALERQEQGYRSSMREPQNASILRQSQFLNALFAHKAFSWTAVMMDLEKVLPGGVQVENIDPTIARDGAVTIRLRVSGDHDRAVDLVRNLEHSKRFLFPRLADEAAETNSQGDRAPLPVSGAGVNMDILAQYNPLPLSPDSSAGGAKPGASKSHASKSDASKSGRARAGRLHAPIAANRRGSASAPSSAPVSAKGGASSGAPPPGRIPQPKAGPQ